MYEIPTSINLGGHEFHIRKDGDYRMVLDCFCALEDTELTGSERVVSALMIFYEDINTVDDLAKFEDIQEAVSEMFKFFNCNGVGKNVNHKLVDWENDSQLICSAVNKVANMEIRSAPYIHWWTFMGYYAAVGESPLSTIIGIRDKIIRGKKLEKYESEFKRNNPSYFVWNSSTVQDQEADKYVREQIWNSGA